jgi:hypothetical protein
MSKLGEIIKDLKELLTHIDPKIIEKTINDMIELNQPLEEEPPGPRRHASAPTGHGTNHLGPDLLDDMCPSAHSP